VAEEKDGYEELGQYDDIKIAVGYARRIQAYYVKLTDTANSGESVLIIDRSDGGYLRFVQTTDFLASLHAGLDAKGLYLDGNEEKLASVVSNLTLQLMERIRNES
jgi:hypothetical protein